MDEVSVQKTLDKEIWDAELAGNWFTVKNGAIRKDIVEEAVIKAYEKQQRVENFFSEEVNQTLKEIRALSGRVIDTVSTAVDDMTRMRTKKQVASHAYIISFTISCAEEALRLLAADERVPSMVREYLSKYARPLEQKMAFGNPDVISAANGPVDPVSYILDIGSRLELTQHSEDERVKLRENVGGPFASPPLPEIGDALEATKFLRALQKRIFALIERDLENK